MLYATVLILGAIWGASCWFLVSALRRIGDHAGALASISGSLDRITEGPEASFSHRMLDLEDAVDRLPKKWEDMLRAASAAEARARQHIRRAQKELEERGFSDAGVDQLGHELHVVDEEGGPGDGVQPLLASVDDSPEGPTSDQANADWRDLARLRKFGAQA